MRSVALLLLLSCTCVACAADDEPARGPRDAAAPAHGDDAGSDDGGGGLCTRCGACEQSVAFSSVTHVDGPIDYDDLPPAGGEHNPCWGDFRVYETPLADERWVHNLEHGGVVFLYHCPEGCAAEVAELGAFVRKRSQALLTPYPELPARFAAVAWGERLVSPCFDLDAFEAFYAAHVGRAPESVTAPPPAACPD